MQKSISEPNMFKSVKRDLVTKAIKSAKSGDNSLDNNIINKYTGYANGMGELIDNVLELFPDISLAIETMTSLVASPNDMDDPSLTYKLDNSYLPSDVKNIILNTISKHVEIEYDIVSKLDEIITETMYTKGSYVELNIPPKNIVDILSMINKNPKAGVESAFKSSAFLDLGISSDVVDTTFNLEVTDNHSCLFTSMMNETKVSSMVSSGIYKKDMNLSAGVESLKLTGLNTAVMDAGDINGDKPIIKKIPSSSVIPISSKDDNTKHYGYFIALDGDGKSISNYNTKYSFDGANALLEDIKKNVKGGKERAPELKNMEDIKELMLVQNLKKYLNDSIYKDLVSLDIDIDDDVMFNIATYALNKTPIKIVFVPRELVSYYAINFRSNGTGEALLERITNLASIRGIILYTNLLSYIKSSVTNTEVKVDLDPEDPNFIKTSEQIMGQVMKNRQVELPIGMMRAEDFVDWTRKLGISFNFKHPGLPDVNIDIEEKNTEITPIESDLKETIDKQIVTALMLPPEILDDSFSPEFATTIIANNKLLAKRVKKTQRKFNVLITEDIKKKLLLDGRLKSVISDIIIANKVKIKHNLKKLDPNINKDAVSKVNDEVLVEYVFTNLFKNFRAVLPKPEVTDDSNVNDMFSNYTDTLDDVIDKIFSSDLLSSDLIGDLSDNLDIAKDAIKVTLMKRFIDENNVLPDLTKMLSLNEDNVPNEDLLTEFNTYVETVSKTLFPFIKENNKIQDKTDDKLEKIDDEEDNVKDDTTGDTSDVTNDTNDDTTEPVDDVDEEEPTK